VEFSPGGGDDGSGVVTLLELLSNLVMDPEITFSHVHLIVLFTSGEELGQRGAQAFVTNHPWNNNIRRFINIDSYSGQEKAILFRVKPSQVSSPFASHVHLFFSPYQSLFMIIGTFLDRTPM
jgi:Zn-dependent M28 family amino/carboxypeptidase